VLQPTVLAQGGWEVRGFARRALARDHPLAHQLSSWIGLGSLFAAPAYSRAYFFVIS